VIRFAAWRLHRRGLLGFTFGGFLISFLYGLAFISAAGKTPAEQAAFGRATMLVATLAIGALVLLLVVNGIADTIDLASGIGVISPFHWMRRPARRRREATQPDGRYADNPAGTGTPPRPRQRRVWCDGESVITRCEPTVIGLTPASSATGPTAKSRSCFRVGC
jgi:hypothetical protein